MIIAKTSVTPFAKVTGMFLESKPYKNQSSVPNAKTEYIEREIPEVSFV